ncbi:hypothetical protein NDU88_002215 [Pleurodeles waltl]|uniref:Uncharacterized protein n=1 Tax=Pleurodeles waltl TaxID=8319 RepID=A0AAV7WKL2_PLEWA|nr:hypothetical protein NDU88_002215 [Pleurodeles waltl]
MSYLGRGLAMFENGRLAEPLKPDCGPRTGQGDTLALFAPLEDQPGTRGGRRCPKSPLDRDMSDLILPPAVSTTTGAYARP